MFLAAAHLAGVQFEKHNEARESPVEATHHNILGWTLFSVGLLAAVLGGYVRYLYLREFGSGNILSAIFTTAVSVITFLLAVFFAARHYSAAMTDLERSRRQRMWANLRLRWITQRFIQRFHRRRALAKGITGQENRILAYAGQQGFDRLNVPDGLEEEHELASLRDHLDYHEWRDDYGKWREKRESQQPMPPPQ